MTNSAMMIAEKKCLFFFSPQKTIFSIFERVCRYKAGLQDVLNPYKKCIIEKYVRLSSQA